MGLGHVPVRDEHNYLDFWVITHKPLDLPQVPYVIRRQRALLDGTGRIEKATEHSEFATLEAARAWCAGKRLYNIGRYADDDSVIVESWI